MNSTPPEKASHAARIETDPMNSTPPEKASRRGVFGVLAAAVAAIVLVAGLCAAALWPRPAPRPAVASRVTKGGVSVEMEVDPVAEDRRGQAPRAGDEVTFRFRITDAATGAPFAKGFPVAWADPRRAGEEEGEGPCRARVRGLLEGSLFRRAEVDLNEYLVLVLGDDATISIVDPRFGFGGTRLLAQVTLPAPAADWALTSDQTALFVSMPEIGRVAVIDPATWTIRREIETAPGPEKIALQPDEERLWVLHRDVAGAPLATVIATRQERVIGRIDEGRGAGGLAFGDDSRSAFLTLPGAGEVAVVDVASLSVTRRVPVGRAPKAVAWSPLSRAAFAADAAGAGIFVVDAEHERPIAHLAVNSRLSGIRIAPGGRVGVAHSAEDGTMVFFDTSSNTLSPPATVPGGPDQVAFSDSLAYVRRRASESVLVLPLARASVAGQAPSAAEFPAGQKAPGDAAIPDAIVTAPGGGAVLVANPADRAVYYYKEGMAAPMGQFSTYGHAPIGVLVLDRSLRERSPGVYETTGRLTRDGAHEVAFVLDSPRIVHCFSLAVAPAPVLGDSAQIVSELVDAEAPLIVGRPGRVRFRLRDAATLAPVTEASGVPVLAYRSPGVWQMRAVAEVEADDVYSFPLIAPEEGVYSIVVMPSSTGAAGLPLAIRAVAQEAAAR
ncbi:MAG: hypothetical protein U0441_08745 [Polyangiaceae bacterium]